MNKKYHYFYEIKNELNGHFYYGIHSTNDMNDGYMGSGTKLHIAYKKYGIENFTKTILKEFKSREEASDYEAEVVNEVLIKDHKCYNCRLGGDAAPPRTIGYVNVKDKETKKSITISQEEFYKNRSKYIAPTEGLIKVVNTQTQKQQWVTPEEFKKGKLEGKYHGVTLGKLPVKDKNGKIFYVDRNDERYLNGELVFMMKGRKHSEETKRKIGQSQIGMWAKEKNPNWGKKWVTKDEVSKLVPKEELQMYLDSGWVMGVIRNYDYSKRKTPVSIKTQLDKNKIIELYNKGMSWKEIAKELNVGTTTLFIFKKENNIYEKRHEVKKINMSKVISLRNKGLIWKDIAKELNISIQTLRKFRKKHNLD